MQHNIRLFNILIRLFFALFQAILEIYHCESLADTSGESAKLVMGRAPIVVVIHILFGRKP